jgi:hypothetical protein
MKETLCNKNLNLVKDVPMIYVNLITTVIAVSEKKKKKKEKKEKKRKKSRRNY